MRRRRRCESHRLLVAKFFFWLNVLNTGDRTPRGEPPTQRGLRATRGARYVVSQEHAPPEGTMRHVACKRRAGQSPPDRAGRRGNVEPRARTGCQKAPISLEGRPVGPSGRAGIAPLGPAGRHRKRDTPSGACRTQPCTQSAPGALGTACQAWAGERNSPRCTRGSRAQADGPPAKVPNGAQQE